MCVCVCFIINHFEELKIPANTKMNTEFENPNVSQFIAKMYMADDLADVHFTFPNSDSAAHPVSLASVSSPINLKTTELEKVPAHKLILASLSPVFKARFYAKGADIVNLADTNIGAFKEFLQIFYLPKIALTARNVEEVVRLAGRFNVLAYFDTCFTSIKNQLTAENMAWGYQLAMSLNNVSLKEFCERQIRSQAKDVLKSHAFTQCNSDVVKHILRLNRLECREIDIFNGCIAWAKTMCRKHGMDDANAKNLKDQLGASFYLLRFDLMEPEEFGNIMLNKTIASLFTTDELTDIIRTKWTKEYRSEFFNQVPRLPQSTQLAQNRLVCVRKYESGPPCHYQEKESTWFSTDELVLLKTIYFDTIHNNSFAKETVEATMKIIEYNANILPTKNSPYKVHGTATYKIDNIANRITFAAPIVINPHNLYEIRLNIKSNIHGFFHLSKYATEVKSENVTITFYQDPLDEDSSRRGLVSQLIFSRN